MAQINKDGTPELVNRDLYNDGGYAISTDTQLILHNNCSKPVTISDFQVLKSCQPPLDGPIFVGQKALSEPTSIDDEGRQLGFDLDSPNPEAMITNGWNVSQWTQEYASGSIATIQGGESYSFDIRAIALHKACSFSIAVRALYDGRPPFTKIIDDYGQPFRVSALLPGLLDEQNGRGHPYAGYGALYVGADASPWHGGTWKRENPRSYT
jgi:hypothetical protein